MPRRADGVAHARQAGRRLAGAPRGRAAGAPTWPGTRLRMAGLVAEDLRRAGGLRLDGLDVVVTGLLPLDARRPGAK